MHASQDIGDLLTYKSKLVQAQPADQAHGEVSNVGQSLTSCRVDLSSVTFAYPSRPSHQVLKNLSLTVQPGQFVALVGPSGCGKSTILSLIERFYDPGSGCISVDDCPITSLDIRQYRQMISLVSQEPILYSTTIRENIAMGHTGHDAEVSEDDIIHVCKMANIHDFVCSLP